MSLGSAQDVITGNPATETSGGTCATGLFYEQTAIILPPPEEPESRAEAMRANIVATAIDGEVPAEPLPAGSKITDSIRKGGCSIGDVLYLSYEGHLSE